MKHLRLSYNCCSSFMAHHAVAMCKLRCVRAAMDFCGKLLRAHAGLDEVLSEEVAQNAMVPAEKILSLAKVKSLFDIEGVLAARAQDIEKEKKESEAAEAEAIARAAESTAEAAVEVAPTPAEPADAIQEHLQPEACEDDAPQTASNEDRVKMFNMIVVPQMALDLIAKLEDQNFEELVDYASMRALSVCHVSDPAAKAVHTT